MDCDGLNEELVFVVGVVDDDNEFPVEGQRPKSALSGLPAHQVYPGVSAYSVCQEFHFGLDVLGVVVDHVGCPESFHVVEVFGRAGGDDFDLGGVLFRDGFPVVVQELDAEGSDASGAAGDNEVFLEREENLFRLIYLLYK